ncbi:hypothetical protein ONE63_000177 [Megalurothrips usitatus]|uniref:Peptidase S1 domain-containing protein n=1 Tax=Megalurothrips usitatus TaxID=439358 RepID=A0AAV7Y4G5_9NEOP|nr:hypothetical protein ONE63_000177 [Megalurothrips usitatus]
MREYKSHICGGSILSATWGGQLANVVWAGEHPQFDIDSMVHDVALMQLDTPLTLDATARPTRLVTPGSKVTGGQLLTVSGWGTLHSGDYLVPEHLMAVMVPVVPLDVCRQVYATQSLFVDDTMLCAGVGGKDSCQGDSGGPLVDDLQVQVGVVSWGIGCASPGYPGLYANLAHPVIHQWIVEKAGLSQ